MAGDGDDDLVVIVDLRGDGYAAVLEREVEEIQREYLRRSGRGSLATNRLLVVDEAADLVAHQAVYRRLTTAPSVEHILLVACGRPAAGAGEGGRVAGNAGGGDEKTLRIPATLQASGAGVLWVGDPRGVNWQPGAGDRVRLVDDAADPTGARNLAALVRALEIRRVFDHVLKTVRDFPHATVSPGIWLMLGRLDDRTLTDAQIQAIAVLTAESTARPGTGRVPAAAETVLALLGGEADVSRAGVGTVLFGQGLLTESGRRAFRHLERARGLLLRLRDPFSAGPPDGAGGGGRPGEAVWAELVAAGDAIQSLATTMRRAFLEVGGAEGVDGHQREELDRLGVAMPAVPAAEPASVTAAFRGLAVSALAGREPLASVSNRFYGLAERMAPQGSGAFAAEVERICPPALGANLSRPPRFPLTFAAPSRLAVAALGGLLTALWWPVGLLAGPLAVATSVALAVWLYWGRPRPSPPRENDPRDLSRWEVVALGAAGVVGVAAGVVAGHRFDLAVPVHIVALVLGLAALGMPYLWWRRAADGWRRALRTEDAHRALGELRELLVKVALNEWVLSNNRGSAARAAGAFAVALETARDVLADTAVHLASSASAESAGPTCRPGVSADIGYQMRDHSGELAEVVHDDLVEAVRSVLEKHRDDFPRAVGDDLVRSVGRSLLAVLDTYAEHLRQRGILEPPPFGRPGTRRDGLVEAVWRNSEPVRQMARAQVDDSRLLQLASPGDLSRLDVSPGGSRLARFAPEAARGEQEGTPASVIWTRQQDLAGAIRLTGLMHGAVEYVMDVGR